MNPVGNASSKLAMPAMALAFTASMKPRAVDLKKGCQLAGNRLITFTSTHPN